MKIVNIFPQTPEWLAWRREGITSTDAAALMNRSDFKSAKDVFDDKLGLAEPIFVNSAMKRGHEFEAEGAHFIASKLKIQEFISPCIEHSSVSFFKSSLDFYDPKSGTIAEIKVPSVSTYQKLKTESAWEEYCERYKYQCQWHLAVSGNKSLWFVVYSPEEKGALLRVISRDEPLIEEMTSVATLFWENLQEGIAPPDEDDDLLVLRPEEAKDVVQEYKRLKIHEKAIQEQLKGLKEQILDYGDDGDFQLWDIVCKRTNGRTSYDYKKMAEDGIDLKKYEKQGIGFYSIKVKE